MSVEVLVPPLENYGEMQEAIGIRPEDLAMAGLHWVDNIHKAQKIKGDGVYRPRFGFVTPYTHNGTRYHLRGVYQREGREFLPMPSEATALGDHLVWYENELERLEDAGIIVPQHLPVIVTDTKRWGEHGSGLFTLVKTVRGRNTEKSLNSRFVRRQGAARDVIESLLEYHSDSSRPADSPWIHDICATRQYIGQTLVDLDPYIEDSLYSNMWDLKRQASRLRGEEGARIQKKVGDRYQQAAEASKAKYEKLRQAR